MATEKTISMEPEAVKNLESLFWPYMMGLYKRQKTFSAGQF